MKKRMAYSLFLSGILLSNVFYLEGGEVDSKCRWEQCKKIIIDGESYTIRRDILVEILLQSGADPNGTCVYDEKLPILYPIEHGEAQKGKAISVIESTIGALLVEYGAEISLLLVKHGADVLEQNKELKKLKRPLLYYAWLEKNKAVLEEKYKKTGEKSLPFNKWQEKEYEYYIRQYMSDYNRLYNPVKEAISRAKRKDPCELEDNESTEEFSQIFSTKLLYKILKLEDEEISLEKIPDFSEEELFKILLKMMELTLIRQKDPDDDSKLTLLEYAKKNERDELVKLLKPYYTEGVS